MTSWVYVFSKFTAEALLFEALVISGLCAGYAAFWVLKKRKEGVLRPATDVPAGVVRTYLSELIVDAEQLRAQLFGLLSASGVQLNAAQGTATAASFASLGLSAPDPEAARKVALLEAKMMEQAKAMDSILTEKSKIEHELALARAKGASAPAAAGGDVGKLQEKIASLEARLAEYSVIEDDLANLKRLQQENAQLRAALNQGGGAALPASGATAAAPAKPVAAPAPAPAAEEAPSVIDQNFEALVDQVEQSLETPAAAAPAAPAAEPAAAAAPTKSDEDLVAEFEKMLNS